MKIAILSNVTAEILAASLRDGNDVWTPPGFGTWVQTALEPPAGLVAFAPDVIALLLDRRFAACEEEGTIEAAVASVSAAFPSAAVIAPDVSAVLADLGDAAYDDRMWALAKMPWSVAALHELVKVLAPPKKVLALDLDNTLWKGIVSEDGVAGIVPDVALQRQALELKGRGVLLVALSKNDESDVAPVWDDPRMLLRPGDFAAMRIDWGAKSANLADVARELNLGTDSFVFVDDSAANRAEMRASLPEVAVAPFPPDLSAYFPPRATTAEDLARTEMYKAEAKRREAARGMSLDDYLRTLGIVNVVRPVEEGDVARVAQLSQKSNQMNALSRRRGEGEIRAFAADPSRVVLALRSSDRFGDLGLVAFVHAKVEGGRAEIADWVMSCRAMGRRIEFALEAELERCLAARGVRELAASWEETPKNGPSRDLFDRLGFDLVGSGPSFRRYARSIAQS
jgi:FkbH-like protein